MIFALRLLAFATAGASLAAFLPVAHAACVYHGFPVPLVLSAMLAVAALTAALAGRKTDRPLRYLAAVQALLAAACVASVSLAAMGAVALVGGSILLAGAVGLVAGAFAQAAPFHLEQIRLAACAALGLAVSTWMTVHFGAPWLGMHGLAWTAAAVHLACAVVSLRLTPPERLTLPGGVAWPASVRAAAIAAAVAASCVAWARALAATLTPTPTVFAAGVAAPMAAVAAGLAIGLWLSRRPWAARVAVPALLLAALAAAHPVPPGTHAGAVAMAFGGPNTPMYAMGVLSDVFVALAPLCVLVGVASAILASARPSALLAGGAVGVGGGVVLVSLLGAVPGATFVPAGVLLLVAATAVPRRPVLALGATALVAVVSVHAWRLGPLPVRCEVLQGIPLSERWDADAFRASVQRSDGTVLRSVDSVVVTGSGREWHSARVAAHLGVMLAPGARLVLLAGPGRDDARQAIITHGGLSIEEAEGIRPALSKGRAWDLVLHRPPIPALWGAGGEYTQEAYEAARAALTPRGVFVQEVSLRAVPLAQLKRLLAGFGRAFPEGSAWFVRETLVLVGGREPVRAELSTILEALALPSVYANLSSMGVCRPWDLLGMYLCDATMISSRLDGARPLRDDEPTEFLDPDPRFPFAYVDGLAWLLEGRQGVGGRVVAGTSRGERWLVACRLDRLRKGSGLALTAQLRYEQTFRAKDNKEASDFTAESLNAATQALKIDPGDRYAYETLSSAARRFGQTADQHAKAPPAPPVDPPPAAWWTFQPQRHEKEVMWLLDRLDTERGFPRIEALTTIESLHDPSLAPLVAELAMDPDPFFRASVAGVIERLGSPSGAQAMVGLLGDTEWNVRRSAAQALGAVGGKGEVGALVGALSDADATVREAAYRAIGAIVKTPLPSFDARGAEEQRRGQVAAIRAWWERR
ncbi:MAG: HEAT repeat domain-containing protein [Planctomycetota bacterium]